VTHSPSSDFDSASTGVAAVERALAIVRAVAVCTEPISLADLARSTGLYKSTLLRLIGSLEKAALVIRRNNGRYSLGPYAHVLGRAYEATYRITETILPLLEDLVNKGTESASFHVYNDARTRACVLRVDSHHSTLDRIRVGDLLPLDRGAAGRLLTHYVLERQPISVTGLVAVSLGERDPSCAAVASPVFGPDGEMCGAISLSGPRERFSAASIRKMSKQLQETARIATVSLGGRWPE